MRLRSIVRGILAATVFGFVWYSTSAIQSQTAGWLLLAVASATLLSLITIALHRKKQA